MHTHVSPQVEGPREALVAVRVWARVAGLATPPGLACALYLFILSISVTSCFRLGSRVSCPFQRKSGTLKIIIVLALALRGGIIGPGRLGGRCITWRDGVIRARTFLTCAQRSLARVMVRFTHFSKSLRSLLMSSGTIVLVSKRNRQIQSKGGEHSIRTCSGRLVLHRLVVLRRPRMIVRAWRSDISLMTGHVRMHRRRRYRSS